MPALSPDQPLALGVALEAAGWHPAAWREPDARPAELLAADYWVDIVSEAERGGFDFVTFEDALSVQSIHRDRQDQRTDQVRGRLDAVLTAARVAPLTTSIGLIPTVLATHTGPVHLAGAIAALDRVSAGRAGVRIRTSSRPDEAAHVGHRSFAEIRREDAGRPAARQQAKELFDEAAGYAEVLREVWRDEVGLPQPLPVVAAVGNGELALAFLARTADLGFLTPRDPAQAAAIVAQVRAAQAAAGRAEEELALIADLLVYLDDDPARAAARKVRLDQRAGRAYSSDARTFAGSPAQLAELMADWRLAGLAGFRLRPATIPADLTQLTGPLMAELRRRGLAGSGERAGSLRGRLGLPELASQFAAARG